MISKTKNNLQTLTISFKDKKRDGSERIVFLIMIWIYWCSSKLH